MDQIDGLIGKAEEYFGRTITTVGFAVIALGMVTAAVKSIWSNLVNPAYKMYLKTGFSWQTFANLSSLLILLGMFLFLVGGFIRDRKEQKAYLEIRRILDRAEKMALETDEMTDRAQTLSVDASERIATANLLIEAATMVLREQGTIGQDRADEILALLSAEPESLP